MAVTVTANLTLISAAESTTGWSGGATDADVKKQGSFCLAAKVSAATSSFTFDLGVQTDLSNTHIRAWMQTTTVGLMDTPALGGMRIRVEDAVTAGNWGEWYVGGNGPASGNAKTYVGGWENFVISTAKAFDATSATAPALTNIRRVGVTFKIVGMVTGASNNCFWDVLRYGAGLTIGGGTDAAPGTWDDVFADDDASANAYGVVNKVAGVFLVQGKLLFGDNIGTTSTVFKDKGQIVLFRDRPVAAGLYEIRVVANATGTNKFDIGTVVGSGDDRKGVVGGIIQSVSTATRWKFDSLTETANINLMNLYGVTLKNAALVQASGATTQRLIGCIFDSCDEVQPKTAEFLSNTIIGPPAVDNALEVTNTTAMKKLVFIAETGGVTEHHAHFPTAGTFTANDWKFFGFGAAGAPDWHGKNDSLGLVTVNATGGSTILGTEIENVGGGSTTTVNNNINATVTVKDEVGAVIVGANVSVRKVSDNSELFGGVTNASGQVTATVAANAGDVRVRVRRGQGGVDYVPIDSPQTVGATDFTFTATMIEDPINTL